MSADPEQEYFCEGMAEELINALTQMSGLRVVSRTSAFQFKGKGYDISEVGKKLKVKTVLEGSVRKAGSRIRITAQLVNTEDGYHLWSERYDRDMDDIFAIQDEISLKIVENLKVKLFGGEKTKLLKRYTVDKEAYQLYLKGCYFWDRRHQVGFQKAIENFQQAIDRDPLYALAYVGLAECYNLLGYFALIPPKEAYPKAKAAVEKALKIDDKLGEAYSAIGYLYTFYDWDWLAAEQAFKRSIILNPNYATAQYWYSLYLAVRGRLDEAITEIKNAQELDPLSHMINTMVGCVYYINRQYDITVEQCHKVIEIDPNFSMAYSILGLAYLAKGMFGEAIKAFTKVVEFFGDSSYALSLLGCANAKAGKREKALKILDQLEALSNKMYVSSHHIAWIYMGLNEKDKVFENLGKAYEERDSNLTFINTFPFWDSIRSDQRFDELLKKIGHEP